MATSVRDSGLRIQQSTATELGTRTTNKGDTDPKEFQAIIVRKLGYDELSRGKCISQLVDGHEIYWM